MRKPSRPAAAAALTAVIALTAAACTGPAAAKGTALPAVAVPRFSHIVVAAFSTKTYADVIGNKSAPYFGSLAAEGANFTRSTAEGRSGQPNYLALFSGSTQGITTDACPQSFSGPNLAADLIAAGDTFTGYAENLPAAGSTVCSSGSYSRANAPWTDFSNVPASDSKPFTAFPPASSYASLPTVSFVTPNTCHIMTTCGIGTGNAWLEHRLGSYAQWAVDSNSLLIVTFGENDGSAGNRIPTIFYGAGVKAGNYSEPVTHYSVLRTIEDSLGLPYDGLAAGATPVTGIWAGGTSPTSPESASASASASSASASPSLSAPASASVPPSASPTGSPSPPPGGIPAFRHVVLVIFENRAFSQVMGTSSASYFNKLAAGGANFTNSHAVTHPSQPNYLALFSGSTQGITNDSCPHTFTTANLGGDLIAAGKTFTGYAEDIPAAGPKVCTSGNYARKHIPWVNFTSIPASATQPFTSFPQAAAGFASLPDFSWVTPNMCDDMHDCSVATGNTWLSSRMSAYASWALANDSLLIVTFDENDGSTGNQIPTIFYGAHVKPGTYPEAITHYSVLRTIEDEFGLPRDGAAAAATPVTDCWTYGS